jgi:hypothetical protein
VTNVSRTVIHSTYVDKTVVHRNDYNHVSYNGGKGGIHTQQLSRRSLRASLQVASATSSETLFHTIRADFCLRGSNK